MDRRDFLRAGAVVGGAVALDAAGLWSRAALGDARQQFRNSVLFGSPAESGIDTVVVCMMENRSTDSYLGWLARDEAYLEAGRSRYGRRFRIHADSFATYPAPDGTPVDTYRRVLYPDPDPWRACGHPDPGHGWTSGRAQRDGGFLAPGSNNDIFALGYFDGADLPMYAALARRFTVCDHWHASCLGPTFPNREYLLSGQSGGNKTNAFPTGNGFPWPTIMDRLMAAGVPVAEYFTDLPPFALWGSRVLHLLRPIDSFATEAAAGQLPNVCFVSPGFLGGNRSDDHPHGDPRAAQRFVRDTFAAFASSPHWERGLFVLTYDEWGGFFDRMAPPHFPDDRKSSDDENDFSQAGFRVPTILCSPRALPGAVDHRLYEHTSVLRFIEWRFLGAPPQGRGGAGSTWWLTTRDRHAANPGLSLSNAHFDPDPGFDLNVAIPEPSPPCGTAGLGALRVAAEESPWEQGLAEGYFERVGFGVATPVG